MKKMLMAGLLALAAAPALAATPAAKAPAAKMTGAKTPAQVAREFFNDGNTGKMKEGMALIEPDAAMIDEFAPHVWTGPDAAQHWLDGFGAWMKANGVTKDEVHMGAVSYSQVDGDTAYVDASATETWMQKGKAMSRPGHLALAFKKEAGGWKISGLGWGGGRPGPAAPKVATAAAGPATAKPAAPAAAAPPKT
ncbi:MAG TPA: nuclear transport factor 2 family protein [Caulobacteraceae bacterium]|jgi:hypothetical protein|nr:nuclear transport factor 2 family protein [Caulobacteraceae bacterium]